MKIADINWEKVAFYNSGSYGVIFKVSKTRVVKVSYRISQGEVARQQYFAYRHRALHVLDYVQGLHLPAAIHELVCPIHGETDAYEEECNCEEPVDALLMPLANDYSIGASDRELQRFITDVSYDCEEHFKCAWEGKRNNVARYKGHLVALDFGYHDS